MGETNVSYVQGTDFNTVNINISEAVKAASNVAVVIVALGEDAYAETGGNIKDLELPEIQQQLVKELAAAGKPIVMVLSEGRPRIIRKIEPHAQSIVLANWAGSQAAPAIADVLFGDYNPDGILPYTYPRFSGELVTYDHKLLNEAVETNAPVYKYEFVFSPQFPFGHGLSYTTFEYSNLKLSAKKLVGNENLRVEVTLKNTGQTAGKHTVELYSSDLYASIVPSVKRLRKYQKVALAPGESQTLMFELNKSDLAFVNEQLTTVTEDGDFEIGIGTLKETFSYLNK